MTNYFFAQTGSSGGSSGGSTGSTANGFPTAIVTDPDTGAIALKDPQSFIGDVLNFVWPTILSYLAARVAWRAIAMFLEVMRGG